MGRNPRQCATTCYHSQVTPDWARSLSRAVRRTPGDLWTAVRTLALAPVVEIGLRTRGLEGTARALRVRLCIDDPADATASQLDLRLSAAERRRLRVAWSVLAIAPLDGSCLRRSLVGARLLRARDPAVRIGVRKTPEGIKAHAWLEIEGISLDPDAPGDFASRWRSVGAAP
jgi:hypothetical protein